MNVREDDRRVPCVVTVAITGSASTPSRAPGGEDPWTNLGDVFFRTGIQTIWLMPEVRFDVTSVSGSVDAWVDIPGG